MAGSDQYRVVFSGRSGEANCVDVLIDSGAASERVVRDALYAQHDISGVNVLKFYSVEGKDAGLAQR